MNLSLRSAFAVALAGLTIWVTQASAQAVPGQGTWETTLQARDIGNTGTTNAFYDTALNITWLANADVLGKVDWNTANSWASNLSVGGVQGWRLPATFVAIQDYKWGYGGTNAGFDVDPSTSEMAHLFTVTLGNHSLMTNGVETPANIRGLTNSGNFINLQNSAYFSSYWGGNSSWLWDNFNGSQLAGPGIWYAMAVHPGDVGTVVASVPEPETYAMLLAGLGLIGAVVRRRQSGMTRTALIRKPE